MFSSHCSFIWQMAFRQVAHRPSALKISLSDKESHVFIHVSSTLHSTWIAIPFWPTLVKRVNVQNYSFIWAGQEGFVVQTNVLFLARYLNTFFFKTICTLFFIKKIFKYPPRVGTLFWHPPICNFLFASINISNRLECLKC